MKKRILMVVTAMFIILTLAAVACKSNAATTSTTTIGPGSGALINSDSFVTVKIQSLTAQPVGFPWKVAVFIQSTSNVGDLPNPVADSIAKVVTVVTDMDMTKYKINDIITAKIKYIGDVNTPAGINLYMYNGAP